MAFGKLPPAPANPGHDPYPVKAGFFGTRQPYRDAWDLERAVTYGFNRSIWVQRCVQAIATNQAKLPIVIRQDDWDVGDIIEKHESLRFLNYKSSPYEIANILRERISQVFLLNRQGVFLEVVRANNGKVKAIYMLPPGQTWPVPDAQTFVRGFMVQYQQLGYVELPPENVIWIRSPHPTDPYAGVTPMEAAGLSIEIDWNTRRFNRDFMQNDMRSAGVVNVKNVDPDEAEEIKRIVNGGAPSRIGVIDAEDMQYVDLSTKPRDAQYKEARAATKEDILIAFGCPESVLGNASGRTFANADAELESFWRETMLPHLGKIARPLDDFVDDAEDHFVGFDFSRVPVLDRDKRERADFALKELQAQGISIDEYREATGRSRVGASKLYSSPALTPIADVDRPYEDPAGQPAPEFNMDSFNQPALDPATGLPAEQVDPALDPAAAPAPADGAPTQAALAAGSVEVKRHRFARHHRITGTPVRVPAGPRPPLSEQEPTELWSLTSSG